jgi:hypothetical protein
MGNDNNDVDHAYNHMMLVFITMAVILFMMMLVMMLIIVMTATLIMTKLNSGASIKFIPSI